MKISRRQFVEDTTVSAAGLCLFGPSGLRRDDLVPAHEDRCAVLDLGSQCALRESFEGYRTVLGEESVCVVDRSPHWPRGCPFVVVPGVVVMDERIGPALRDLLETGATVLLESGAGFCDRGEFVVHQSALRRFFDLQVREPVDVWSERTAAPYVQYQWPLKAIVRDFSRVIPAVPGNEEVVGHVGELPVALKRQVDRGQLIFLGSPLGPALRAGDVEACGWLRELCSTIRQSLWSSAKS